MYVYHECSTLHPALALANTMIEKDLSAQLRRVNRVATEQQMCMIPIGAASGDECMGNWVAALLESYVIRARAVQHKNKGLRGYVSKWLCLEY